MHEQWNINEYSRSEFHGGLPYSSMEMVHLFILLHRLRFFWSNNMLFFIPIKYLIGAGKLFKVICHIQVWDQALPTQTHHQGLQRSIGSWN